MFIFFTMAQWIIWIIIGLVSLFILWLIISYNRFVSIRNQVNNAWAQIDVQLKRRTDLIPNLINTVKGYAKHERETLDSVTKARSALMDAQSPKENAEADNMLTGALKSLFAVSEAYPDLKANQNFLQLQEELTGTENKIAYARQYYNDRVMQYNTRRESFPSNVTANIFNFGPKEMFDVPEEEKKVPKVSF